MPIRTGTLTLTLCILASALLVRAGSAPAQALLPEDQEYRPLAHPQPTSSPGKIEVIEFFSYACPHCSEFYPLLSSWVAKLPKDVVFRRVPVGFNRPAWVNMARAYYALEASGDLARLDGALFHAIHEEKLKLFDEPSLAEWVGARGGNAERFAAAYTSFGVNNQTVQADRMTEEYGIEGVPALVINGEYLALGSNFAAMLVNADHAIAHVRAAGSTGRAAAKRP